MRMEQVRKILTSAMLITLVGCSSGTSSFSLFPSGHYLTRQTRQVLRETPTPPQVPRELSKTVLPAYYVEPGDVLLVEPVSADSDVRVPIDQTVQLDGTIDIGAYGRVVVAGLTLEEIERLVESQIESVEDERIQINVRLLETRAVFYVLGEVNSPGAYPLSGRETVLDGILAAGGLTQQASLCDLLLARPTDPCHCRVTLPVCYRQIAQLGDASSNYQLQPGDRIYVGTQPFCEKIAFWRRKTACPLCDRCDQNACCNPRLADYDNPLACVPASPPIPQPVDNSANASASDDAPAEDDMFSEPIPRPTLDDVPPIE